MCKAMEEMRNETLKRGMQDVALRLLKKGTMSVEEIAETCNLTVEEVKELTMQPA